MGKTFLEVFPTLENSVIQKGLLAALIGNSGSDSWKSPETDRHYSIYFIPLTQNNIVYGAIVVAHDNTDIIKASEKLQEFNVHLEEKNRELERSNSDLERFAYVASHDLQEPLRKIRMFTGLIKDKISPDDDQVQTYVDKVIKSSDRMSDLIKDVLNYSRTSNTEQSFESTDLNSVIHHVLSDFDLVIDEKKAKITLDNLPKIEAIELQMYQLFHNLIGNSLKFSSAHTAPEIHISAATLTSEELMEKDLNGKGTYYHIILKDNGIGFDQKFAEKIFVIFQRLNERQKFEGTGIGLALCRKIVTIHNGTIYAESTQGEGTEFHIIIPAKHTANTSS